MLATIHNNSQYTLAVHGKEFAGLVAPQGSIEVPQDAARVWLARKTPAAFVSKGLVRVSGLEAVEHTPPPIPGNNVPKPTPRPALKGKPVHWKKMLRTVSGLDDLDALQELHASESRPRILAAIESRMAELQGG